MTTPDTTGKNELYWAYNLPLQVWPTDDSKETCQILNYMPRKHAAKMVDLDLGEQTHEEFFNTAADKLEHLAKLMRAAAKDPDLTAYYHDQKLNP